MLKAATAVALLVLLTGACTHQDTAAVATGRAAAASAGAPSGGAAPLKAIAARSPGHWTSTAASLPDHGELVAYPGNVVRRTGAYTWHRAAVSEAHALAAIASGHLRLTTPDGRLLDIRYDRHVEHPSGDWTWIGHLAGHEGVQTVLTIGAHAVFGNIGQDVGLPLRLTMRDGQPWLVETDAARIAALDNAATRPDHTDFHVVPRPRNRTLGAGAVQGKPQGAARVAKVDPAAGEIVDVLVGYTQGFLSAQGSESAALTRINFLVDVTNVAYDNGGVAGQVRLVHAMLVPNYEDATSNETALEELSGYVVGTGQTTPAPAFADLRAAREKYGADLVSLVRDFRDPENDGCGIAWLLGGSLQGMSPGDGWDQLGYSVVSDGVDVSEEDGKSYFCRDVTFAHELGHNMGAAHDRETAEGDDGTLDNPDDYGAFTYSFGYKTGNFYTVMAYGDSGQTGYTIFSTPDSTFCGGNPCGTAGDDNVRTLNATLPVVAGFRGTLVGPALAKVRGDFNGDGASDVLWRQVGTGANAIWLSADKFNAQGVSPLDPDWTVEGIGDFDADGIGDIFWRNVSTGADRIWKSADSGLLLPSGDVSGNTWRIVGVGDVDADAESDVIWRNFRTGANAIWLSGNKGQPMAMTTITDLDWQIVGVGDFDADGRADVLWRHARSGANAIWDGARYAERHNLKRITDLDWQVQAIGDFNGDGEDDILWRHVTTGYAAIWDSADYYARHNLVRIADLRWVMEEVADYNGDGLADILWRHSSSGANAIWPGAEYEDSYYLRPVTDLNWHIQP